MIGMKNSEIRYLTHVIGKCIRLLHQNIYPYKEIKLGARGQKHHVHFSNQLLVSPIRNPCKLDSLKSNQYGKFVALLLLVWLLSVITMHYSYFLIHGICKYFEACFQEIERTFSKQTLLQILAPTLNNVWILIQEWWHVNNVGVCFFIRGSKSFCIWSVCIFKNNGLNLVCNRQTCCVITHFKCVMT